MTLLMNDLLLAHRAVIGGTLSLGKVFNWPAANAARFATALVHVEFLAEIPGVAVHVDVVAQRSTADLDGHLQNGLHRAREACHFLRLQAARLPLGPNARP